MNFKLILVHVDAVDAPIVAFVANDILGRDLI
jgi:hypothetical protein